MKVSTLQEKFAHDLGDIYDAEHRFLEAQREMSTQATAEPLKAMLQEHIGQTEQQIQTLEQIYEMLGEKRKRVKCDAAAGLVSEGQKSMMDAAENPLIRDLAIAGVVAKVEHYEVASYRGLVLACQEMGQSPIEKLLRQNLQQEEKTADRVEKSMPTLIQQAMVQ